MTVTATPASNPTTAASPEATPAPVASVGGEKQITAKDPPAADKPPASEAPQRYELTAPKGHSTSAGVLGAFSTAAFEAGLNQEIAQKLLGKVVPDLAAMQAKQIETERAEWSKATKLDKEIGGDKLDENLAATKKVLNAFASAPLQQLLEETGLGSHPEFLRMLFKISKGVSEDKIVQGNGSQTEETSLAKRLFPTFK